MASPDIDEGAAGMAGFTEIGILLLVVLAGETQIAFDVSSTETISPSANVEVEKLGLFVPELLLFIFH